jgi:hypothetical protein
MSTPDVEPQPGEYTLQTPSIQPVPPSKYPWKALPTATTEDDVVKVSIIPTSKLKGPRNIFTSFEAEDKLELLN